MRTINFRGQEHDSAHEASVELNFPGDHAISMGCRFFTASTAEFHRLESLGIQPTVWHDHAAMARIMSVPGRH